MTLKQIKENKKENNGVYNTLDKEYKNGLLIPVFLLGQ